MRIAFVAPYQGPTLVKSRPCVRNLSLGTTTKIALVAELLRMNSHEVEILSQGEVIEPSFTLYPSFSEREPFDPKIPVSYSSALPVRFLNGFWSSRGTLRLFKKRHNLAPFDAVIIYNLKPPQVTCAKYAIGRLGLPVILEYEDDHFLRVPGSNDNRLPSKLYLAAAKRLLGCLSGCVSGSPRLLAQITANVPKLLMCGVVAEAIAKAVQARNGDRRNWVVFSGTHSKPQGLEQLIEAWKLVKPSGWELHIAGHGQMTATLHKLAEGVPTIVFHGLLNREQNATLLTSGKIAVVPYEVAETQGFSFKTIECLAAGLHVITTPLVALEGFDPGMARGITYIKDNRPETIGKSLTNAIAERLFERTAAKATLDIYGPAAVAISLEAFLTKVVGSRGN
jgi:glycosyltransferase involved in cell wall biosynthesis